MILGKKMKNTKEMITVKEYCKKYKITDAAVRKQINQKKLNSLIYQEITYIVIDSIEKETLKNNIKIKNQKLKTLEQEKHFYDNQKDTIFELKNKIEKLESKLEEQRDKKEELYEKFIGEVLTKTNVLKMTN